MLSIVMTVTPIGLLYSDPNLANNLLGDTPTELVQMCDFKISWRIFAAMLCT